MQKLVSIIFLCLLGTNLFAAIDNAKNADMINVFKYGSIGTDHFAGIPYDLWRVMPRLCRNKLPDPKGLANYGQFGFIQEPGRITPIGISVSEHALGTIRSVGINCATCHTSTYRSRAADPPQVVYGMPANRLNIMAYSRFLFECASDSEQMSTARIVEAWNESGERSLKREIPLLALLPALRSAAATTLKALDVFKNRSLIQDQVGMTLRILISRFSLEKNSFLLMRLSEMSTLCPFGMVKFEEVFRVTGMVLF